MNTITLHLNDIRDLFVAPEFNPFDPHSRDRSGMDYIAETLKPQALNHQLVTVIVLPQAQIDRDLPGRVRAAVTRYCRAGIEENRLELASLRWQGLKSLQTGVLFLGLCLLLAAGANGAEFLPESVRRLASEGFMIAGWVSMWHPAELLLYTWWPHWRQIRLHEHIIRMDIVVEPEVIEDAVYAR